MFNSETVIKITVTYNCYVKCIVCNIDRNEKCDVIKYRKDEKQEEKYREIKSASNSKSSLEVVASHITRRRGNALRDPSSRQSESAIYNAPCRPS